MDATSQPPYTFRDFVTFKIRRTFGRFTGWTTPRGPVGARYAVFLGRSRETMIPAYLLTAETRAALPPEPA